MKSAVETYRANCEATAAPLEPNLLEMMTMLDLLRHRAYEEGLDEGSRLEKLRQKNVIRRKGKKLTRRIARQATNDGMNAFFRSGLADFTICRIPITNDLSFLQSLGLLLHRQFKAGISEGMRQADEYYARQTAAPPLNAFFGGVQA